MWSLLEQVAGEPAARGVAIAGNGGGKQALETVQRLLPVLCQAHGLTPEQVVAEPPRLSRRLFPLRG
ncbi:hypothetical protein Xmlv_19460 [Xanthomonas citri pv. malvacearum]|nr:hypothetical protein Xmlv_19460 [Xanthomonas citri pv. malvacearum]